MPFCRHCLYRKRNRARGLCLACSLDPEIRALYPAKVSRFTSRGAGLGAPVRQLPARPTDELPGTPGKVKVLAGRAGRGEGLWHPDDATWSKANERA